MLEKPCIRCGVTQPVEAFTKNWRHRDGRINKCKGCVRVEQNARYHQTRGKGRAERSAAKRTAALQATSKTCRLCDEEKPLDRFHRNDTYIGGRASACMSCVAERASAKCTVGRRRRSKLRPAKVAARNAINNAINQGRLVRGSCEICGNANAHGHHDDYSKPFEVRWLCRQHHDEWHRRHGQAA